MYSTLKIFLLSSAPALGMILNLQSKLHIGLEKVRELIICIYKDGCRAVSDQSKPGKGAYMHVLIHDTAAQLLIWKKIFSGSSQKLFYQNSF